MKKVEEEDEDEKKMNKKDKWRQMKRGKIWRGINWKTKIKRI